MLKSGRWRWLMLAAIVLGALLVRAHNVSRVFLWLDETDMFNEYVYGAHPKSLVDFAMTTRDTTTVTWGWPAVIWIVSKTFGATIGTARMATVLVSTLGVLLIFFLFYRLLRSDFSGNRFVLAIGAALLAALSMAQTEFSQRTYPYGIAPCLAAAILLAHFELLRAAAGTWKPSPRLFRAAALYTVAVAIALCIHASLALLPVVSVLFLSMGAVPAFLQQPREGRKRLLFMAAGMGAVLFSIALLNAKNPKFGFRPYLANYYTPHSLKAIPTLLAHAYDLGTYHLNLFYNSNLYWPERLNPVILPLVMVCVLGWTLAALGRFGAYARHFALLGLTAITLPALLSFVNMFPFGGVRQSLFLSPFFLGFAAMGFYFLGSSKIARVPAVAMAVAYLGLWAVNLPRFYEDRLPVYTANDLLDTWRQNGSLPVYARECERELRYTLREHPEVRVETLPREAKVPYLLVSTHNWIGDNRWYSGFPEYLKKSRQKAILLKQGQGKNLQARSQSIYFPPNGFWVYMVDSE